MIRKVLEDWRALYEEAKKAVPQKPDGSVSEVDIMCQLKRIIPFDAEAAVERKAKQIIDALCQVAPDEDTGQLCFEGFGTWNWEPLRLIRSEDGDIIENYKATLKFKVADAQRSERNAANAQRSSRRKRHEADVFLKWTIAKLELGEPASGLTWQRCIDELGLHDPLAKPAEDEDEDGQ